MFEKNLAYEASAGSGKTFMLVVRYLSLLYMGADPAKILALTFTNKAANEMHERVVATLETLEQRGELEVIAQTTGMEKKELLSKRDALLRHFLKSPTKIMTIDSFFTKILRKFSLYVALMPDFETLSSQHETKLLSHFLKHTDVTNSKQVLIDLAIESQRRVQDIFSLLDDFYIKSKELENFRFEKLPQYPLQERALNIVATMRELVLASPKASKNAKNAFVVARFEDILSKSWLGRETLEYSTFSKCYTPRLDELLHELYEVLREWFHAREQNFFYALQHLSGIYQEAKRSLYKAENEVGFGDVTMLVYEILKERIDTEFLYFRLDAQIEHILLDEFQDTSILQYEILHPLIQEALSGKGVKEDGSFFFVGDTKQSIYRFRGGVSSLFWEVARLNGTKVEKLTTNYRSKKEIVDFVNETFRSKIHGYTNQKVQKDAKGGYVCVETMEQPFEKVFEKTAALLAAGAKESDIAVLCFTNADGEALREYLASKGMRVVTETTVKLIHQKGVKALLEYLKYLYFKEDIFKENFYALIGKEPAVEFVDFSKKTVLQIVKEAIDRYEIFAKDFNLLAFMEIVARYESIEELLFNYERIERDAVSASVEGIRILTVHKSKGLEYEHVLVVDRLGNPPPRRESVIYDYEGIELKNIFLRIKGRDKLDKNYAEALKRSARLAEEDMLNALYVAFTRAKRDLFILKKEKRSVFDILELQEQERGVIEPVELRSGAQQQRAAVVPHKELYYGSQSNLLESSEKEEEEDLEAIHFGIGMHYALEMMEHFESTSVNNAIEALRNRYGAILDEKAIVEIKRRIERLVENERFKELVLGKCFKEQGVKYGKKLYYLDLLVEGEAGFRVIDYKTGKQGAKEHKKQVRNYIKAVASISEKPVEGYLCYILDEGIEIEKV